MAKRPRLVLSLCLFLLGSPTSLLAQSTPSQPSEATLEAAKDFFRKGNIELDAGNLERALDYFLQSRKLLPSIANTNNAAMVLEKLGRLDESLEFYEALLSHFAPQLQSDERTAISNKVASLREQIGLLEVSANVDGLLIIDGRKRGTVPLATPLRLLPGAHVLRVIKDGYSPAEVTISIRSGQTTQVDLQLEALSSIGRLRVTDSSGAKDVEVLVDGAPVGAAPWEGSLGPGRRLVALRGKDVGTAPVAINVLAGQVVKIDLKAVRLGPPLNVVFEPISAQVSIDGVEVGAGPWRGRLPAGEHTFEGFEEGYLSAAVQVGVLQTTVSLPLKVNEEHPRWRRTTGTWRLGGQLSLATANSLRGEAEMVCTTCDAVHGGLITAQLSYRLPNHLVFDITAGIVDLEHKFSREYSVGPLKYQLEDQLRLRGLMAQLGVGYQLGISKRWSLVGRLGAGILSAKTNDVISGNIRDEDTSVGLTVDQSGTPSRSLSLLFVSSLNVEVQLSRKLHLGFGLGGILSLLDGPRLEHGEVGPSSPCNSDKIEKLPCLKANNFTANERAYSRFLLWTPQISLGSDFLGAAMYKTMTSRKHRSTLLTLLALLPLSWVTPASALDWEISKPADALPAGVIKPVLVPLSDGRTLVIGGLTNTQGAPPNFQPTQSVYLIDPSSSGPKSTTVALMSTPRYGHTATLLPGGKVLVTGGVETYGGPALESAEVYDPAQNKWTNVDSMGAKRVFATATLLSNGKVLLIGGRDNNNGSNEGTLDSAESFDPFAKDGAGKWNGLAPMKIGNDSKGRYSHSATLLNDGRLLVAGGARGGGASKEALLLDFKAPSGNPWSIVKDLPGARADHTAVRMRSGQVLLLGGCKNLPSFAIYSEGNASECKPENDLFYYSPVTGKWDSIVIPSNPPSLLGGRAILGLNNGWVLAVGGRLSGKDEISNSQRVSFFKAPGATSSLPGNTEVDLSSGWIWVDDSSLSLNQHRAFSGITVDQKGRVIVVGGLKESFTGGTAMTTFEYLPYLENGKDCPSNGLELDCASGICFEGVCCDKRCDSECGSCRGANTFLGKDGICSAFVTKEGSACGLSGAACSLDNKVSYGACTNGVCDITLHDCGNFKCVDGNKCPTECSKDNDCVKESICTPSKDDPKKYECTKSLGNDSICKKDNDCESGNCRNKDAASTSKPDPLKVCCAKECPPDSCAGTGIFRYFCDGGASCKKEFENCLGFACTNNTGVAVCYTSCESEKECDPFHYCKDKLCIPQKTLGESCQKNAECGNDTFCVEGVCCDNKDCAISGCRSCRGIHTGGVDGECRSISKGLDPKNSCEDEVHATSPNVCGKTGACDGQGECAFVEAGENKECLSICDVNSITKYTCDGNGGCKQNSKGDCEQGLVCSEDKLSCKESCSKNDDCAGGTICINGKCLLECLKPEDCKHGYNCNIITKKCVQSPVCTDESHYLDENGAPMACRTNHRCDIQSSLPAQCMKECTTSADCFSPNICGANGECRPPLVAIDDSDCFCSQPGHPASSSAPAALALFGLALSFFRRRSSRACN